MWRLFSPNEESEANQMTPTFKDEVMLAGWSETHNGGAKVTFWLSDSSALEAFKRMTVAKGKTAGQRLACVLVEIDDNEQPVGNEGTLKVPLIEPKKAGVTGLALLAVQWCQDVEFQSWLSLAFGDPVKNEQQAKEVVCYLCGITSRKELNTDPAAKNLFEQDIRGPYMLYQNKGQQ